jgi:peptidoglycan hydrolase-like protein with peptidoglycan-binding domain
MKKTAFFIFLILTAVATLHADDQTAAVQQELKDQGFYYGQVDGQSGGETSAAIRRYQIRNGLQVTGSLTQETLKSLKLPGTPAPATTVRNTTPPPPKPAPLQTQQQQPPAPQDITQSDREFLRKQSAVAAATPAPIPAPPAPAPPNNPNIVPPPVVVTQLQPQPQPQLVPSGIQYATLFVRTPYQNAPLDVQQATLRNAQARLSRQTYYNGEIDGIPGPATEQALLAFQSDAGFARTGRLDIETLNALHLLPNATVQRRVIIQPFFPPPRRYYYLQPRVVIRGNWGD